MIMVGGVGAEPTAKVMDGVRADPMVVVGGVEADPTAMEVMVMAMEVDGVDLYPVEDTVDTEKVMVVMVMEGMVVADMVNTYTKYGQYLW